MITAGIYDKQGHCLQETSGEAKAHLLISRSYQPGDSLRLSLEKGCYYRIALDTGLGSSTVYAKEAFFVYQIPFPEERLPYPPGSFEGEYHIAEVEKLGGELLKAVRDLSTNAHDIRSETSLYPHCTASVETRGESIFAARNTIDGYTETKGHGVWPFTSWGDHEDPQAEITVWFGRNVCVKRLTVFLRADFPHDNYWNQVSLVCSDGSKQQISLQKTGEGQSFELPSVVCEWIRLCELQKGEPGASPFPALTQWIIYGSEE